MLVIGGISAGISRPSVSAPGPAALYTTSIRMLGSGGKEKAYKWKYRQIPVTAQFPITGSYVHVLALTFVASVPSPRLDSLALYASSISSWYFARIAVLSGVPFVVRSSNLSGLVTNIIPFDIIEWRGEALLASSTSGLLTIAKN
jgi:hypothetical protein